MTNIKTHIAPVMVTTGKRKKKKKNPATDSRPKPRSVKFSTAAGVLGTKPSRKRKRKKARAQACERTPARTKPKRRKRRKRPKRRKGPGDDGADLGPLEPRDRERVAMEASLVRDREILARERARVDALQKRLGEIEAGGAVISTGVARAAGAPAPAPTAPVTPAAARQRSPAAEQRTALETPADVAHRTRSSMATLNELRSAAAASAKEMAKKAGEAVRNDMQEAVRNDPTVLLDVNRVASIVGESIAGAFGQHASSIALAGAGSARDVASSVARRVADEVVGRSVRGIGAVPQGREAMETFASSVLRDVMALSSNMLRERAMGVASATATEALEGLDEQVGSGLRSLKPEHLITRQAAEAVALFDRHTRAAKRLAEADRRIQQTAAEDPLALEESLFELRQRSTDPELVGDVQVEELRRAVAAARAGQVGAGFPMRRRKKKLQRQGF